MAGSQKAHLDPTELGKGISLTVQAWVGSRTPWHPPTPCDYPNFFKGLRGSEGMGGGRGRTRRPTSRGASPPPPLQAALHGARAWKKTGSGKQPRQTRKEPG